LLFVAMERAVLKSNLLGSSGWGATSPSSSLRQHGGRQDSFLAPRSAQRPPQ